MNRLFIVIALVCLCLQGAHAEQADHAALFPSHQNDTFTVRFENDVLAIPRSDQNYTMGLGFFWSTKSKVGSHTIDNAPGQGLLDLANSYIWILGHGPSENNPVDKTRAVGLYDDAFTPKCLHSASTCASQGEDITQDRPYANLIAYTTSQTSPANLDGEFGWRTEFSVGLLGTSIGREFQRWVHKRCCKDKIPQEWGTQIGNGSGGTPVFLYKQINTYNKDIGDFSLQTSYGFWAGWYTWPTVGLRLNHKWASIEADASYVLHDELLQGTYLGDNAVRYSYGQIEHVVELMHMEFNLTRIFRDMTGWGKDDDWEIKFSQHWKSRDIKNSSVERRHRWGGITYVNRF